MIKYYIDEYASSRLYFSVRRPSQNEIAFFARRIHRRGNP